VLELEGLWVSRLSPALQMRGVTRTSTTSLDSTGRESFWHAMDDDGVVARVREGRPEETVGLGRGGAVGLGAPACRRLRPPRATTGQPARGPVVQDERLSGWSP